MRAAIIGRSGTGKSTLIRMLDNGECKVPILHETSREILEKYKEQSTEFKQIKMLYNQWYREECAKNFLSDRGLHDYVVYSRLAGVSGKFYERQLDHRYNLVFRLPDRPFEQDGIRVEKNEQEAARIQGLIDDLYLRTGHSLIFVPNVDVKSKYDFIMEYVRHAK